MTVKAQTHLWAAAGELDTPYKRARAEWDSRIGTAVVQAKNWRFVAFISLALLAVALGGLVYLGAQSKLEPHIVELDKTGKATYRGKLSETWAHFKPSEAAITYHLRRFIYDIRQISTDRDVVKNNLLDAYALVTTEAATMLNESFRKTNPLDLVGKMRVSVEIKSMVPISKTSWQCDWQETTSNLQGAQVGTETFRGIFRLSLKKPESAEQLEQNPVGLYIEECHWSTLSD